MIIRCDVTVRSLFNWKICWSQVKSERERKRGALDSQSIFLLWPKPRFPKQTKKTHQGKLQIYRNEHKILYVVTVVDVGGARHRWKGWVCLMQCCMLGLQMTSKWCQLFSAGHCFVVFILCEEPKQTLLVSMCRNSSCSVTSWTVLKVRMWACRRNAVNPRAGPSHDGNELFCII